MTTDHVTRPAKSRRAYLSPRLTEWRFLDTTEGIQQDKGHEGARKPNEDLEQQLLSSLKMENLVVLAGSGCSLSIGGPSMTDLWRAIVESTHSDLAKSVAGKTKFNIERNNIEELLSHIDAWLSINDDDEVKDFLKKAKNTILEKCTSFLNAGVAPTSHETLLHRLSRRRERDQRLKLFTTNYDLCFEKAIGNIGGVAIDGFSFMAPRRYDPRYFDYDIIQRPRTSNNPTNYLKGVVLLYKLHGSVNWARTEDSSIIQQEKPPADKACLIYPAKGKYQQSYSQPYLESIAQYLSAIREPNTCIVVLGFGFNDDHLSEPLLAAVRTNPHLRLLVVDPFLQEKSESNQLNQKQQEIFNLARRGEDIWLINADFEQFVNLIPDLKALTPPERLWNALQVGHGGA